MTAFKRTTLATNWQWRLADANSDSKAVEKSTELEKWTPVTAFPSVIHMELLANKIIPDYNIGSNERLIQWVGEADWSYRTTFSTPSDVAAAGTVELVFDGLDTYATITLNGKEILKSNNMFIQYRVDVKGQLQPQGQDNELSILFESNEKKGAEFDRKYKKLKTMFRSSKRCHLRKPQVLTFRSISERILRLINMHSLRLDLTGPLASSLSARTCPSIWKCCLLGFAMSRLFPTLVTTTPRPRSLFHSTLLEAGQRP
jgi:hypothetical protein